LRSFVGPIDENVLSLSDVFEGGGGEGREANEKKKNERLYESK